MLKGNVIYQHNLCICFSRPSALGPISRPSALGLSAPQILSVQFQGLGWYNRDEILKLSIKYSYLQKYNIHYQQKNFSCLVCTWYICRLAICQLRHRHCGINKYN